MRKGLTICGVLAALAAAAPAQAQYGAPFGTPGLYTVPETGGALGAGAALNAAEQSQSCTTQPPTGRSGYRPPCNAEPTPAPRR